MYSKLFTLCCLVAVASCHMRMLDPPGRPSLWRFPEFEQYSPVLVDTDDQMWCDNIRQFEQDTRCGVCGDAHTQPTPRDSEYRGRFWRDVKVRTYRSGDTIPIYLQTYAPHGGGVEVQICDRVPETEDCFRPMLLGNGDTYWPMRLGDGSTEIHTTAKIPDGMRCESCVIRMHYRGAQNWGDCDSSRTCECDPNSNPPGGMGCSEQQTFRACADVKIE